MSSKPLEDELNQIRKDFIPSLGKKHGRVVLKGAKSHLEKRLHEFGLKLSSYQDNIAKELQKHLDESKKQVVDYYLQRAIDTPPDALLGQSLFGKPTKEDVCKWLETELDKVFPKAKSLVSNMSLEIRYKDVTFETLNREDFLEAVKSAFPNVNWNKAHDEFKAAGETAK